MITKETLDKLTDEQIDEQLIRALTSCEIHLCNALNDDGDIKQNHIKNALSDLKDVDIIIDYDRPALWLQFWK